jgi:hypothetical protein
MENSAMLRTLARPFSGLGSARAARLVRRPSGPRRRRRLWVPEGLEGRFLLSSGPTIYTVTTPGGDISGSGNSGTLPYVIGLANANPNTAGSMIQFDPTVKASSQTITLSSTLVLSETAGPEVIDGPGAIGVTDSSNKDGSVFIVPPGVTASLSGLTISGGSADYGGGIANYGT